MNKNKLLSITYIVLGILFYITSIYIMTNYPVDAQQVHGNLKIVNYVQNINLDLNTVKIEGSKHFELVLMPFLFGTVFLLIGNIGLFFKKEHKN